MESGLLVCTMTSQVPADAVGFVASIKNVLQGVGKHRLTERRQLADMHSSGLDVLGPRRYTHQR